MLLAFFLAAASAAAVSPSPLPLFLTFDSGVKNVTANVSLARREAFVWGASPAHVAAWKLASPHTTLSYYMPYSRAPLFWPMLLKGASEGMTSMSRSPNWLAV